MDPVSGVASPDEQYRAACVLAQSVPPGSDLASILYRGWYNAESGAGPGSGNSTAPTAVMPECLLASYRAVDASADVFESGWTVADPAAGPAADWAGVATGRSSPWAVLVERGGVILWADLSDVRSPRIGCRPAVGASVAVCVRRDDSDSQPGWWMRTSKGWVSGDDAVRVYWNAPPSVAPRLVGYLTASLPSHGWAVKALRRPVDFDRSDTVVTYVDRSSWPAVVPALTEGAIRFSGQLRAAVPQLTKPVRPGVGIADEVPGGSFGTERCRLLAKAVESARDDDPDANVDQLVAAVRQVMTGAGLDPDRPWLRRADTDELEWEIA